MEEDEAGFARVAGSVNGRARRARRSRRRRSAVWEMAVWRVLTVRWGGRLDYWVSLCYQTGPAEVTTTAAAALSTHGLRQRSTERQSFFAPSPRGLTAAQIVFRHHNPHYCVHWSLGAWLATTTSSSHSTARDLMSDQVTVSASHFYTQWTPP